MTHYTFSITLGSGQDEAVAKIRVIEKTTLFDLADALLDAIGFEPDHAFGFHSNLESPYDQNMEREYTLFADQGERRLASDTGVEKTWISSVFESGDRMLFHFDYGDDWMFIVECLEVETTANGKRKPEVLEMKGEFPEQYPEEEEEDEEEDEGNVAVGTI